ncbi:hypothetical protein SVAN01_08801 [Stagonosporopsis vannaccii]|nr:hypothetical protein SVAN01_08801 [Stagonosporopsis vannaccii]
MTVEGSAYGEPELSSHSTSRRSSIDPPFTPTMPIKQPFISPDEAGNSSGHFNGPNDHNEDQWPFDNDPKVDHSFMGFHLATPLYSSNQPDSSAFGGSWLETIPEQPWQASYSKSSQPSSQQTTSVPPEQPATDTASSQRIDALAGTWQMIEDSTWTRCDGGALPWNGDGIADHPFHLTNSNVSAGPNYTASRSSNESTVNEKFPPVECEVCGERYNGKWAMNNKLRHARLKHATELPKAYVCKVCQKSYKRSDALRNHENLKHATRHRGSATRR